MKLYKNIVRIETRSGFGDALLKLGKENTKIVALCADLTNSLSMTKFSKLFPYRFFQIGIAAGLTIGILEIIFLLLEHLQILLLLEFMIKFVNQLFIIKKMLPGLVVINTCDYNQTYAATIAISKYIGPVYLRFGRPAVPNFTSDKNLFQIGKAIILKKGEDVTGHLVWESL